MKIHTLFATCITACAILTLSSCGDSEEEATAPAKDTAPATATTSPAAQAKEEADNTPPPPTVDLSPYFPAGVIRKGEQVTVSFPDEFKEINQRIDKIARTLTPEEIKSIQSSSKPGQPLPNNPKFFADKAAYDTYLAAWDKRSVEKTINVVGGLTPTATDSNILYFACSTDNKALPISTLKYDPSKDAWTSPNGTLKRKKDIVYDEQNNLGAWVAHEWVFESDNVFGKCAENILIGKTDDGKHIYVIYNMIEVSPQGRPTQQPITLVLRFPAL